MSLFKAGAEWREGGPGTGESASEQYRHWQNYNQDTLIQ